MQKVKYTILTVSLNSNVIKSRARMCMWVCDRRHIYLAYIIAENNKTLLK